VQAQGVGLRYRLARQRISTFKELAIRWLRRTLTYDSLWALRGVSFRADEGERVAIVGRNGAGKSTLLRVLAGVLPPTEGRVVATGRMAPILGLSAGFNAELTGLENIHLNALLLGRSRDEAEAVVDDVVDFSELSDFIHSPLRNYSSGMVARLSFSVATAWIPDVLLLDEALAVGDIGFLEKCKERLHRYQEHGTTVLMVSHSVEAVRRTCTRCLWLERGRLIADGAVEPVLQAYWRSLRG
jgi:ABC-2 type transport system ATP-binding protein/lipopolysaccharide transport system ATP-binding protein